MTMDDLKNFRQLGSRTPGHPEVETAGVEIGTGPLGQGVSNAVGMAIAEANLAATFTRRDSPSLTITSMLFVVMVVWRRVFLMRLLRWQVI